MATKAQIAKRFKDGYYSPKKASKQEIRKAEALLENIFNASAKFLGKPDFKTASEYAKHLFKNKDKDEVFEGAVEATIISFKSQQTCYSKGIRSKSAGLRRTSREEMYALGRQIQYHVQKAVLPAPPVPQEAIVEANGYPVMIVEVRLDGKINTGLRFDATSDELPIMHKIVARMSDMPIKNREAVIEEFKSACIRITNEHKKRIYAQNAKRF
jgi:hypothetical protein